MVCSAVISSASWRLKRAATEENLYPDCAALPPLAWGPKHEQLSNVILFQLWGFVLPAGNSEPPHVGLLQDSKSDLCGPSPPPLCVAVGRCLWILYA